MATVSGATYKWYAAASGGTAISGATSNTYTPTSYTGGATNSYWATVTNSGGCESGRTQVSIFVSNPPSIATQTSAATICANGIVSITLTAGTIGSFNTITWTPTTNLYTDAGATTAYIGGHAATVYYKRSTAVTGDVITATGTQTGTPDCITTATASIIVYANPSITTTTATPSSVCSGNLVTLNAATTGVTSGTAVIGLGATTTSTYNAPFYSLYSNKHMQILIKAAELTAGSLAAGNITTVSFPTTSGTIINPDYTLKMKLSTGVADMSSFVTSGFTTVYTNATGLVQSAGTDNTFTLDVPFNWDGTSDLIVEICFGNAAAITTLSSTSPADATSYVSVIKTHNTTATSGSSICGNTTSNSLT